MEPRIRQICGQLLDVCLKQDEMDFAADFSVPLPLVVIAEMLGVPGSDHSRFRHWSDVILRMSYTIGDSGETAQEAARQFQATTIEMATYLETLLAERSRVPRDDLLTRLLRSELDGVNLTREEILGFFQLLLLAGSETTSDLLNNAMLCFIENPEQLLRLRSDPERLAPAIEEVLRYRSPVQWMYRVTRCDCEFYSQSIPAGKLVLAVIGAANRDPHTFCDPEQFDISRDPNPHLAFGHAIHFCLGASLARLEARIALTAVFERLDGFELASRDPWEPRKGLHVHGPTRLPLRFQRKPAVQSAI